MGEVKGRVDEAVSHGRYARVSGHELLHDHRSAGPALVVLADHSGQSLGVGIDEIQDVDELHAGRRIARVGSNARHACEASR